MNIFRIKQLSQYIHSESRNYENYMKDLKTIREKDSNKVERHIGDSWRFMFDCVIIPFILIVNLLCSN